MTATIPRLPEDWRGVAAHVHTAANLPESECQGEQTYAQAAETVQARGMSGLFVTEHTTNPGVGKPHPFMRDSPLAAAIMGHLDRMCGDRGLKARTGVTIFGGVEANILGVRLDVSVPLVQECDAVIASFHGEVPKTPRRYERRFRMACDYRPEYGTPIIIGHPWRYVEGLGIDWAALFRYAAEHGVVIEANFNAWNTYGPGKIKRDLARGQGSQTDLEWNEAFNDRIYGLLGDSGAKVLKSLDIHNRYMWPRAEPMKDYQPSYALLTEFDDLTVRHGLTGVRVVNRTLQAFNGYCSSGGT